MIKDAGRNIDFQVEPISHAASTQRWGRLRFHGEYTPSRQWNALHSVSRVVKEQNTLFYLS